METREEDRGRLCIRDWNAINDDRKFLYSTRKENGTNERERVKERKINTKKYEIDKDEGNEAGNH